MNWVIEIAKLLPICIGTAFILALAITLFPATMRKPPASI
jgi:hypothetical protein